MISTKRGVNVLTIPLIALSIRVWANANKNAGIKLPIKPEIKIKRKYFGFTFCSHENAKGIINTDADSIRIDATCGAE